MIRVVVDRHLGSNRANAIIFCKDREQPHGDRLCRFCNKHDVGIQTYNAAINVLVDGRQVVPWRTLQYEDGFKIGIVTSVPVTHATPARAYANNVTRKKI